MGALIWRKSWWATNSPDTKCYLNKGPLITQNNTVHETMVLPSKEQTSLHRRTPGAFWLLAKMLRASEEITPS